MDINNSTRIADAAGYASGNNTILNISEVFKTIYGYLPAKVPGMPQMPTDVNPFEVGGSYTEKRTTLKGSPLYGLQDVIGREVFCPVTFVVGGKEYYFPYAVLGLKSRKILNETPMVERGGRAIEGIGIDAWIITLKGFLIQPYGLFPDEELDALNQVWKYKLPVRLKCALTDLFLETDDQVVIADIDIPEKAKVIGVKDFSLSIIQDTILDLYKVD